MSGEERGVNPGVDCPDLRGQTTQGVGVGQGAHSDGRHGQHSPPDPTKIQ